MKSGLILSGGRNSETFNYMRKMNKAIIGLLWVFILFLLGYNFVYAEPGKIELDFNHQTLSATIKNAPLRNVIAEIKKEKGVWFKLWLRGKESILDEKYSVQFKELPVKDGIERIFSPLNYSLVFDQNDDLLGVVLLGKPDKRRYGGSRRTTTRRRYPRRIRR
jgi:hypothetical protein